MSWRCVHHFASERWLADECQAGSAVETMINFRKVLRGLARTVSKSVSRHIVAGMQTVRVAESSSVNPLVFHLLFPLFSLYLL